MDTVDNSPGRNGAQPPWVGGEDRARVQALLKVARRTVHLPYCPVQTQTGVPHTWGRRPVALHSTRRFYRCLTCQTVGRLTEALVAASVWTQGGLGSLEAAERPDGLLPVAAVGGPGPQGPGAG